MDQTPKLMSPQAGVGWRHYAPRRDLTKQAPELTSDTSNSTRRCASVLQTQDRSCLGPAPPTAVARAHRTNCLRRRPRGKTPHQHQSANQPHQMRACATLIYLHPLPTQEGRSPKPWRQKQCPPRNRPKVEPFHTLTRARATGNQHEPLRHYNRK